MELAEELELPPWEKFRRYGHFPFKLVLHITLVALVSTLVIATNLSYAAYSRSVWLGIANIMYPADYSRLQTDLSSPFQYFIYTQNQTIHDGNRLFLQYFKLANESVNEVNIFSTTNNMYDIRAPFVAVHATTGVETYIVEDPHDNSWPLAYHNLNTTNQRSFFNNLKHMEFNFFLRSDSNGAGYSIDRAACFFWHWQISYRGFGAGQILVDATADIQSSCEQLSSRSATFIMAVSVFIVALWYQVLLLKAIARQIIVISRLSDPLFWTRWQIQQEEEESLTHNLMLANAAGSVEANSIASPSAAHDNKVAAASDIMFRYGAGGASRFSTQRNESDSDDADVGESKEGVSASWNPLQPDRRGQQTSRSKSTGSAIAIDSVSKRSSTEHNASTDTSKGKPLLSASQLRDRMVDSSVDTFEARDKFPTGDVDLITQRSRQPSRNDSQASVRSRVDSMSRQSRLVTLATLEADLRLLTDAFEGLTWQDRLMVFNIWFLVSTVGNLFALIYSSRIIFFRDDVMASLFLKSCLGITCLMYWFCLIQYLEFFPRYYIMISMLKITVPRVSQFLLGVLPVFFGYALLGMICFGDVTDRFGSVTETLRSLFAVVNGDIIYDTFNAIEFSGIGGQVYLYVYILIFTYVVLMTIIAIVEEAFFEAQERKGLGPTEYSDEDQKPATNDSVVKSSSISSGQSQSQYVPPSTAHTNAHSNAAIDGNGVDDLSANNAVLPRPPSTTPASSNTTTAATDAGGLRRQSSLRPADDPSATAGASSSGKRELPENVKLLLRNVNRMPSLTGNNNASSSAGGNTGDILSAAFVSYGGISIGSSIQQQSIPGGDPGRPVGTPTAGNSSKTTGNNSSRK